VNRRVFCYSMLAVPTVMSAAKLQISGDGPSSSIAASWDSSRKIKFILSDPLEHPFYWWPRTLLSYPIEFHQPVELDRLMLSRTDTGERISIQFSEVVQGHDGLKSATLNFFSDLPSGAHREFVLSVADSPSPSKPQVSEVHEGNTIVLDSGVVRVRIPASQVVRGDAPGPIMQLSRGGKWIGSSVLEFDGDKVTRISTTRAEQGPLFIAYEVHYESEGGSHYIARVQCNGGLDFVRLQENMEGMRPEVRGTFTSNWTGFAVTHRQAPNHPFPLPDKVLTYEDYAWEKIDEPWTKPDVRFGSSRPIYPEAFPAGQLPIILGIYEPAPGNTTIGTWANYWDRHSGDALGIFIDDVTDWQDHEFAYEVESSTLQVRSYYQDGKFFWKWPLTAGRRSTCIAFYDHIKDKEAMQALERASQPINQDGLTYQVPLSFTSHALFLENRYGTLNLNQVKDWVLDYPDGARRPAVIFSGGQIKTAAELERSIMTSPFVCTLPATGTRQMDGHGPIPGRSIVNFSPVPSRQIQGWWIDGFNRLSTSMSERQRARLTAMYLFTAYVLAGDDFMPQVPMLSGHPNYFADVKSAAPAMSFLFPDHPMASAWADMWQKCVALNTRYNTRPSVKAWNADGGRWTEDIGTYVWAFLRPSLRTEFLLRKYDGVERFATPQLAEMADWLVNALSAPFNGENKEGFQSLLAADHGREWGVVGPGEGPRRVYPPIGAHSEQRIPPRSLWYLGTCLQRYAPLAAEHAMWASRPTDQDAESQPGNEPPWDDIIYRVAENRGTNPHLRSRKHTGYGVVLRAAVGTPEELSIHLQQIDQGPNYRWGWAAEGGCGLIYFFAAGKAYSFNGSEDVGDRRDQDTDFCTNFGVFKDGVFRSIGENVLSRPFYNLGAGQFAEILPREAPSQDSTPEYVSRSILLVGHDYFVVYDAVVNQSIVHRLSWFVRRGSELPSIQLVYGASANDRETQRTDHQTDATTGVWFDGVGDSMAVVSHRKDVQVQATGFGCRVQVAGATDLIFRSPAPVRFSDGTTVFEGTAGLIRTASGKTEFALFHGTLIGVSGITFSVEDTDLGVGGSIVAGQAPSGEYHAPRPSSVRIAMASLSDKTTFYVDGEARTARRESGTLVIDLLAGSHHWELTDTLPVPIAPHVVRTENNAGGARVVIAPVASATQYRLELSQDNGATWSKISMQNQPQIELSGISDGQKVHVRAVALNSMHESPPGPEYPVYVTNQAPIYPDGLHVDLTGGAATVTWGEVLGTSEYRLYVRSKGEKEFRPLYRGRDRVFVDKRTDIEACNPIPGKSIRAMHGEIFEYAIAAANGNGESAMSRIADTDPASWRNWDPRPGERFRRVYNYAPGSPPSATEFPRYYPE
jgi:hypothetical protein